jgi:hypothetical protein
LLQESNKKLKDELETATKCSSQEEWKLRKIEKENKKLKDDLDRIEEIKDREWIKLLNENERLSKELEKKEKSLRAWRKLKK